MTTYIFTEIAFPERADFNIEIPPLHVIAEDAGLEFDL